MNSDAHARQVLVTKIVAAATSYGFVILLARVMKPEEFGLVAYFLNIALLVSVAGACGQQMALLRFIPQLRAQNKTSDLATLISAAFRRAVLGGFAGGLLCFIGFAISRWSGTKTFEPQVMLFGFALIPALGWIDIQSHLARALGFYRLSLIPKEILWRAGSGTIVLGLYLANSHAVVAIKPVLITMLLVLIVLALAQRYYLSTLTTFAQIQHRQTPAKPGKDRAKASGRFWISSVSNIFLANADVIAVGIFAGPFEAGIYFAANRLAQVLAFFATSYNIVIAPKLAAAWHEGRIARSNDILRNATIKSSLPTLVLGLILWQLSPFFLQLFGPGFTGAELPLKILIIAGIVNTAAGPSDIALKMCGFEKAAVRAAAASVIFSTLALIIGGVAWGASGVATAVLIATVFRKALYWGLTFRYLTVRCDILSALWSTRKHQISPQI